MRTTELKARDIVFYKGEIYRVESNSTSEENEDITPIPLTSEILEGNRWKKENGGWRRGALFLLPYTGNASFIVYGGIGSNSVYMHDIKYVHELQHILWALGMDDNLKICQKESLKK